MVIYYYKVILFFIVASSIVIAFGKKKVIGNKNKLYFYCFNLIVTLILSMMIGKVNLWKDTITLTSLRQEGKNNDVTDIFIDYILNDGEEITLTDVTSGHWYFANETIFWQSETRNSSLSNLTDSVTARIPLGIRRTLQFQEKHKGGYVQVDIRNQSYIIDISDIGESYQYELPDSSHGLYLLQVALQLLLVIILSLGSIGSTFLFIRKYSNNDMKIYHMIASAGTAAIVLYMWLYRENMTVWLDEMYQIAFVAKSFQDTQNVATTSMSDPALYSTLAWIWYQIVPFGTAYLTVLPEALSLAGLYILGYFATKQWNVKIGAISYCLMAINPIFYLQFAFDLRQYAMWFLACVLLYFSYFIHIENTKWTSNIFYIAMMGMATLTHYIGIILCGVMFLFDVYFVIRRKKDKKILIPYLLVFVCAIPIVIWFVKKFLVHSQGGSIALPVFWSASYGIDAWNVILLYLVSNSIVLLILFFVGVLEAVRGQVVEKQSKSLILLGIGFGYVAVMFFYSFIIVGSDKCGYTRYYICLLPIVVILAAHGIQKLLQVFQLKKIDSVIIVLGLLLALGVQNWNIVQEKVLEDKDVYKNSADWLTTEYKEIYKEDTIIIFERGNNAVEGWEEYFLKRKGLRDGANCISEYDINWDKLYNQYYGKVYIFGTINQDIVDYLEQYYDKAGGKPEYEIREYNRTW